MLQRRKVLKDRIATQLSFRTTVGAASSVSSSVSPQLGSRNKSMAAK